VSAKQLVAAWQVPNLTPAVRLVLLDLADCADHEGRNAFRSEQTIADWCQISLRTVKRAIAELLKRKLITIQELPRQRKSTTYQLQLAAVARGVNLSPLGAPGVTLGVTNRRLSGDKTAGPSTKDDPGIDPGDPRFADVLRVIRSAMRAHPGCTPDFLRAKVLQELGRDDQLVLRAIMHSRSSAV
jgi:hypothetical protein